VTNSPSLEVRTASTSALKSTPWQSMSSNFTRPLVQTVLIDGWEDLFGQLNGTLTRTLSSPLEWIRDPDVQPPVMAGTP